MDSGAEASTGGGTTAVEQTARPGIFDQDRIDVAIPVNIPTIKLMTKNKRPEPEGLHADMEEASRRSKKQKQSKGTQAPKCDAPALGVSRSNQASVAQNNSVRNGTFVADDDRLKEWKAKILAIDDRVEFPSPECGVVVRHVTCGKKVRMKNPYNVAHWDRHTSSCRNRLITNKNKNKKTKAAAGMQTLAVLFSGQDHKHEQEANEKYTLAIAPPAASTVCIQAKDVQPALPDPQGEGYPCPGLSAERYPSVEGYLGRTGALGGGARSISVIAHEKYKKDFIKLSDDRQKLVLLMQRHEWTWRNEHGLGKVYATTACTKVVKAKGTTEPCSGCLGILNSRAFKNVLRVPTPPDNQRKYTNEIYQNRVLAKLYGKVTGLRAIMESPVSPRSTYHFIAMFRCSFDMYRIQFARRSSALRLAHSMAQSVTRYSLAWSRQ